MRTSFLRAYGTLSISQLARCQSISSLTAAASVATRLHGVPRAPPDLLGHRLLGYDQDETIDRGFAMMGLDVPRKAFAFRTDDQLAYARLMANGAGLGFVALYALTDCRAWCK